MTEALIGLALRNASLCGAFDPFRLVDAIGLPDGDDRRGEALRELSLRCSESILRDGAATLYRWTLAPDCRRAALEELISPHMVRLALDAAPELQAKDRFGLLLRGALRDAKVAEPARADEETDEAFLNRLLRFWGEAFDAAQFAEYAPGRDLGKVRDLRNRASQRIRALRSECDIHFVLPKIRTRRQDGGVVEESIPLIGRDHYRGQLSRHLRGRRRPQPVLLTGIGGAGKSALLASLLKPWRDRADAPISIILDFDRRQLVSGEPVQFMHEFLRQLATGLATKTPVSGDRLAALLAFIGELRDALPSRAPTGDARSFDSQFSFMLSAVFPRLEEEAAQPLKDLSVALVMDSFEAVDRQGGAVVSTLMQIEEKLRAHGLTGLRTVVSGRAPPLPEEELERFFGPPARRIHLRGVGKVSGGRLLQAHDLGGVFTARAQRETASVALGGHPLALMILGRYAETHKGDAESLLRELTSGDRFKAEFAQAMLYTRILGRIADTKVRALAHPGLALRQINADMIRLVLAGPCFDRAVPAHEAEDLLRRLQNEYWMVEPGDENFPVRHRADLRRLMTPGLFAGPSKTDDADAARRKTELRDRARAVCRAAAALFRDGPPPDDPANGWWRALPAADREVEALYYRALGADETPEFGRDLANRLHLLLGEDLETLPTAWIARVKAWRGEPLSELEMETLSPDLRERAESAAFERMERRGGSMAAKKASRRPKHPELTVTPIGSPEIAPESVKPMSAPQMEREISRSFMMADFDGVAELGPRYLEAAKEEGMSPAPGDDLWESAAWRCLLVAGARPEPVWSTIKVEEGRKDPPAWVIRTLEKIVQGVPLGPESPPDLIGLFTDLFAIIPEQMPLCASRRAGADLTHLTLGPRPPGAPGNMTHPKDTFFTLSPRAFALAALRPDPDDPSRRGAAPQLPGTLTFLIDPLYQEKQPTLALFQRIYRSGELIRCFDLDVLQLAPEARQLFALMLRGLSPELYEPAAAMLRELPDIAVVSATAELNQTYAANWPQDLRFEQVKHYDPAQAATIVETADQCGALGDLLRMLAGQDPRAAILARMHELIGEWFFPRPTDAA